MKALVTGASGFVGGHLVRELLKQGDQVRILHRSGSNLEKFAGLAVEPCAGDLSDRASLLQAMRGVDVVYHCAALYREAKFPDSAYWTVNFEGTRNALEAARECNVGRFIHTSTTGVMGSIENPPASEDHPYLPGDVYQESKTEAEKLALEWFRGGKIDGCVIRPAMIWGPEDRRLFKLFKGVAFRSLPIIGDGRTLNHYILVQDLARAYRLAAEVPGARGQLFLIANERYVTLEYTLQVIAKIYGVSLFPFKIPALPVQLLGSVVEKICKPFGLEPPIHRRRVDFFVKSRAFDTSKAARELGFKPSFTFEKETEVVARWYVENGWIPKDRVRLTAPREAHPSLHQGYVG